MRLTLRTMLAYMDDILGPEQGLSIAKKIEESEFATNLLHRTRDVMRRLRLGAPNVMDREEGLDPNTVAEYLDNTLSDERVADFEKVCLESEMHLAEVASCHQVLALVLGEPAGVEPDSRQRMYHLPEVLWERDQAEAADPCQPAGADDSPFDTERIDLPHRAKSPIPEYLRRSRRRRLVWPVATVVILLILLVAFLANNERFWPGTNPPDAAGFESGGAIQLPDEPASRVSQPPAASTASSQDPTGSEGMGTVTDGGEGPSAGLPLPSETTFVPAKPIERIGGPMEETRPAPTGDLSVAETETVGGPAAADIASVTRPAGQPLSVSRDESSAGLDPMGEPVSSSALPRLPDLPRLPAQQVAISTATDDILLRWDATNQWHRLADQTALMATDRLLSLPTFRPSLLLAGTIEIVIIDGTQVQLLPPDKQGISGIIIDSGRVVIRPLPGDPSALRLQIGATRGVLGLSDQDAVVAVSISRPVGSMNDPETQPPPATATMFAATGVCDWMEESSPAPIVIRSPAQCTLTDHPAEVVPLAEIPAWIESDVSSSLDRRASARVEQAVAVDHDVTLRLKELAEDRQREVRWLAIRCLSWIDDFELLVATLNDREQNLLWQDTFAELRGAVMRSPMVAARVRTEMERQHGSEGVALYEMVWAHSKDKLTQQDAARLIGYLEHETLAFRVLAFLNLQEQTGLGFFYRPEGTATSRQRAVQGWKKRFGVGEFRRSNGADRGVLSLDREND